MVACCQRGETVLTLGRKVTLKVNEASESNLNDYDTATAGLYCSSVMRRVCSTMVWCPHFTACTLQVRGSTRGVPEEYQRYQCSVTMFSSGGPLRYSMEGHQFAIFAMRLTSDCRYIVSVSNR